MGMENTEYKFAGKLFTHGSLTCKDGGAAITNMLLWQEIIVG